MISDIFLHQLFTIRVKIMNAENNSTTVALLDRLFGDVLVNASQSTTTGSYRITSASSWSHTYQNVTSESVEGDSYTGLPFSLITRIVVIVCVVIGLFLVSLASYTVHRKCVKDGWKQYHNKPMFP